MVARERPGDPPLDPADRDPADRDPSDRDPSDLDPSDLEAGDPEALERAAHDPAARRRRRRSRLVSLLLFALLVGAFGWALAGKWDDVGAAIRGQNPAVLALAFLLCIAGTVMSFFIWRGVLANLGSPVSVPVGARMFFVAQLGKYLPGSVWPVVAQMRMGKEAGIPRSRTGLAFLLTLGLSVAWGLVVGLLALPTLLRDAGRPLLALLLVLPLVGLLFVPRFLNWLINAALRLMRRQPLEDPLSGRAVAAASGWMAVFWFVYGSHLYVLVLGMGGDPLHSLPVSIGAFALAFSAGPLLVVLPAGAGVREAVLVLLLSSVISAPEATAVAILSRVMLMLTDGLLAGGAALLPHLLRGRAERSARPAGPS